MTQSETQFSTSHRRSRPLGPDGGRARRLRQLRPHHVNQCVSPQCGRQEDRRVWGQEDTQEGWNSSPREESVLDIYLTRFSGLI